MPTVLFRPWAPAARASWYVAAGSPRQPGLRLGSTIAQRGLAAAWSELLDWLATSQAAQNQIVNSFADPQFSEGQSPMLFNSDEFLFVFLPATLSGFYLLGTISRTSAVRWLILASLVFYAWWRPVNVLIIAPSIVINFALARMLLQLNEGDGSPGASKAVLLLGISFNVVFLGFFEYTDFISGTINDVFGANLVLRHIILPLGISFITFQKIAFLIDVQAGRVRSFTFQDYCIFVLFFPQLIAGPIVHAMARSAGSLRLLEECASAVQPVGEKRGF